ncbi:MAG: hypothetical protein D0528_00680 [Methylococcales bacterium]|nr:MAG: hypothetical protein D0528_00680 [Methylococcales bacterium]
MGKIIISKGDFLEFSRATLKEFEANVSEHKINENLLQICNFLQNDNKQTKVCYIFGMGALPLSFYKKIEIMIGVEVVFYRTVLPPILKFLGFFIASYEGLVKIHNPLMLHGVFEILMSQSMVGLYIFDTEIETDFVNSVQNMQFKYDFGVKKDEGYLIYLVDADNDRSDTGIIEIISFGRDCPSEIQLS